MLNKIIVLFVLLSTSLVAQNYYKTDNFTVWRVLSHNTQDKYIVVKAKDQALLNRFRPICTRSDAWIFNYEMMGFDDAFYNAQSQPTDLKYLTKSAEYMMKIDIEENNIYSGKSSSQKICADNQAQRYFSAQNNNKYGLITYVGNENITPPF